MGHPGLAVAARLRRAGFQGGGGLTPMVWKRRRPENRYAHADWKGGLLYFQRHRPHGNLCHLWNL